MARSDRVRSCPRRRSRGSYRLSPVASRRIVRPAAKRAVAPAVTRPCPSTADQSSRSISSSSAQSVPRSGGAQCPGQFRSGGLVEAHRHARVADLVVAGRRQVLRSVVLVEPGAITLLVAHEPVDGRLCRAAELVRADRRAAFRWRHRQETRPPGSGRGSGRRATPGSRSSRAGPPNAREEEGGQREPCRQRQPAEHERRGRGTAEPRAIPVHDLDRGACPRGLDPKSGQPVEPADDGPQLPLRIDANHAITGRRRRPDHQCRDGEDREDLY